MRNTLIYLLCNGKIQEAIKELLSYFDERQIKDAFDLVVIQSAHLSFLRQSRLQNSITQESYNKGLLALTSILLDIINDFIK